MAIIIETVIIFIIALAMVVMAWRADDFSLFSKIGATIFVVALLSLAVSLVARYYRARKGKN